VSEQSEQPTPGPILYTIYEHPLDFPDEYICRRWIAGGIKTDTLDKGEPYLRAPSLTALRKLLPPGLSCIGRIVWDGPVIQEVWV
jgi:hypothetical protein